MKYLSALAAVAVAASLSGPALAQVEVPADIAARAKIYAVPTRNLTDTQFLTGAAGQQVSVGGELRLPQGKGPFPAMVLMHGSSGVGSNIDVWVRQFNALGIATFVIDSVTGRGYDQLGDQQAAVGRLNFITDIYGALDILAHDPQIDPKKIGLIGFSRGGQAALYASSTRFNTLWNKSGARFANYIAFYPNCVTTYRDDEKVEPGPIRIFHGGADNYNPANVCESYAERLKQAGADVEMTVYPGGEHGFDVPTLFGKVIALKSAQTARACKLREGSDGKIINLETGREFTYDDACVQLGPNVGGDAKAAQEAHAAVQAFLEQQFGLAPKGVK